METRQSTEIPFLKLNASEKVLGSKLPTKQHVFQYFYFLHHLQGNTLSEASHTAIKAVKVFWDDAGVKTMKDLENIHNAYKVCF